MARAAKKAEHSFSINPYTGKLTREIMDEYFLRYKPNAQIKALVVAMENPKEFTIDEIQSLQDRVEVIQSLSYRIYSKSPTSESLNKIHLIDALLESL